MRYVDVNGWRAKRRLVEKELARQIPILIRECGDDIIKRTIKNVSGPQIHPRVKGSEDSRIGKMPVPRRTGTLARSIKRMPLFYNAEMIYADKKVANYAKWVHYGTRYMKPRRFLGDVISTRGPAWVNRWRYAVLVAIRKYGRPI